MAGERAVRVAVIRPYASLPSDGTFNDRYISLCESLLALGAAPTFYCSDFVHNQKRRRSSEELQLSAQRLSYLRPIRSIAYRDNMSLARVAHEGWFGLKVLWLLARGPRPQAVVVGEPLFFVGWIALAYGFFSGAPILADLNDLWPEADTTVRRGLAGLLRGLTYRLLIVSRGARLKRFRALTFVSRSYAERLAPKAAEAKVFYLGSRLSPPPGGGKRVETPVVAIYAGSFGLGYDIETLLQAAEVLRGEKAAVRVVVAGAGPKRDLVERAHREGAIEYLGQVGQDRLIRAYAQAEIGLLPYSAGSLVAMPNKFFDYMNFGLFIVSSLTLEARELIKETKIGLSYQPGDARDLAAKLSEAAARRDAIAEARSACALLAREFAVDLQYRRFAQFVLDRARLPP
jgi:glycosyltransferase involved in cell wall biosynthesis